MNKTAATGAVTCSPPPPPLAGFDLYARHALAGGLCCQATHTLLVPMDVVKTRLQTSPGVCPSAIHMMRTIVQHEGYRALLLGITPTFVGYSLQGAGKFSLNEWFKDMAKERLTPVECDTYRLPIYLCSSTLAESISSVLLCPWEAVRIRIVSDGNIRTPTLATFRAIIGVEGVPGLYKGLGPLLAKQVPYTVTQLTVFSASLDIFYEQVLPTIRSHKHTKDSLTTSQQLGVSVSAGALAGVASAIISHPADTILSQINMKKAIDTAQPRSVSAIISHLGFRGIWTGLGTRCVMVATLSAGMFLIYDTVKLACGLPTSGRSSTR